MLLEKFRMLEVFHASLDCDAQRYKQIFFQICITTYKFENIRIFVLQNEHIP